MTRKTLRNQHAVAVRRHYLRQLLAWSKRIGPEVPQHIRAAVAQLRADIQYYKDRSSEPIADDPIDREET